MKNKLILAISLCLTLILVLGAAAFAEDTTPVAEEKPMDNISTVEVYTAPVEAEIEGPAEVVEENIPTEQKETMEATKEGLAPAEKGKEEEIAEAVEEIAEPKSEAEEEVVTKPKAEEDVAESEEEKGKTEEVADSEENPKTEDDNLEGEGEGENLLEENNLDNAEEVVEDSEETEEEPTQSESHHYTVDLTYQEVTVNIPGDTMGNPLSGVLAQVGIEGEIAEATVYQDVECLNAGENGEVKNGDLVLYRVYQKEDSNWYIDAVNSFTTEHGLLVRVRNGETVTEYKIKVTDPQSDPGIWYYGNGQTSGDDFFESCKIGHTVTISDIRDIKKTGCDFLGWNTKKDGRGDSYTPGNPYKMETKDGLYLYAQWTEPKKITPQASDFTFTTPASTKYDGTAKTVTVTSLKEGMGNVTVYYSTDQTTWTSYAPSQVGNDYYVAIDVDESDSYAQASKLTCADWKFNITKRSVTLTSASAEKEYDGTPLTDSTVTVTGDGFADGEGATYSGFITRTYPGDSIPNDFTYTLNEGTKAENYTITQCFGTLTVTARKITVIGTIVESKGYDGSTGTAATMGTINGIVGEEKVSVTIKSTQFDNANAGTDKTVTVVYEISGDDIGNYIKPDNGKFTASIAPAQLTVDGTIVSNKTYDGTTNATAKIGVINGVIGSDDVDATVESATFDTANVGTGKAVTVVYKITGADAGNYAKPANETIGADITKSTALKFVVMGTTEEYGDRSYSFVYDGRLHLSDAAEPTISTDVGTIIYMSKDNIEWEATTFPNIVYASDEVINTKGWIKAENPNYETAYGSVIFVVAPLQLTIEGTTVEDKTYDGNTDAKVIVGVLKGCVSGDDVSPTATGAFEDEKIGEGKNVFVVYALTGADAKNYLVPTSETLKASIKAQPIPSGGDTTNAKVVVVVEPVTVDSLPKAQQEAVNETLKAKNLTLLAAFQVYVLNGDIRTNKGDADFQIDVSAIKGYDSKTLRAWKINDDNTMIEVLYEVVNGKIIFNHGELGTYILTA